jgi:hypothetical protein
MRNVSDKSCKENQNTHFMHSVILFSEIRAMCEIMEKYGTARKTTDDKMAQALCMLGK